MQQAGHMLKRSNFLFPGPYMWSHGTVQRKALGSTFNCLFFKPLI